MRCTLPPAGLPAEAARANRALLPVLETERLVLRVPEMGDLPLWTRILGSGDARFLGGVCDAEAAWESFCVYVAGWLLHGHGLMTVTRRSDGAVIGFVVLGLEWGDPEPELGWMLAPEARGEGYATEAAAALRDWGFGLMPGFVSFIDPENGASAAVARRLGARRDEANTDADGDHIWRHSAGAAA